MLIVTYASERGKQAYVHFSMPLTWHSMKAPPGRQLLNNAFRSSKQVLQDFMHVEEHTRDNRMQPWVTCLSSPLGALSWYVMCTTMARPLKLW